MAVSPGEEFLVRPKRKIVGVVSPTPSAVQ